MKIKFFILVSFFIIGFSCQNEQLKQENNTENMHIKTQSLTDNKDGHNASMNFDYVVIKDTPYYEQGPMQGRSPHGTFLAGTKVKIIRADINYPKVESENGVKAFVDSQDIKKIN